MKYKLNKDRKIVKGRIIECIASDCKNLANVEGLCWKHFYQQKEEEIADDTQSDLYGDRGED